MPPHICITWGRREYINRQNDTLEIIEAQFDNKLLYISRLTSRAKKPCTGTYIAKSKRTSKINRWHYGNHLTPPTTQGKQLIVACKQLRIKD